MTDRAQEVAGLLARLTHRAYGDGYRDGLKPAQWSALRYFSLANRFSKTSSAFAQYHGTSRAAASQTIASLIARQLLIKTQDPSDGRKHTLNLSSRAARLVLTDPLGSLALAAEHLASEERLVLQRCLEKMLTRINADEPQAAFGYCGDCQFLRCRMRGNTEDFHCAKAGEALEKQELDQVCANFVAN